MTKIILMGILLFLVGGLFLSQINSHSPTRISAHTKIIRFATDATYPPFEYVDENGSIKGYDIDIANALCTQIKAQCVFINSSYDKLIPSLNTKKFDAIIGSIAISDIHKDELRFTNVNYNPTLSFVASVEKHYIAGDIFGKTIGVVKDSSYESYLKNKYRKDVTEKSYDTINDALDDLKAGNVDMVLGDTMAIKNWLRENDTTNTFGIFAGPIINNQYFGSGFGIGVRQNDTKSLNALNKALIEIKVNGTYDRITRKYFGG